jgi:hypothetical protein
MITPTGNDDSGFVLLANRLVDAAIAGLRPAEVHLIQIDRWFDAKWLKFSGKVLGALGLWKRQITIPPFHPNRVLSEIHLSAATDSDAFVPTPAAPLHIAQQSTDNHTRFISRVSPSAIFFWYSSSTVALDRASTMLYRTDQDEVFTWYASFRKTPAWKLDRHRGISPVEVQHLLQCA